MIHTSEEAQSALFLLLNSITADNRQFSSRPSTGSWAIRNFGICCPSRAHTEAGELIRWIDTGDAQVFTVTSADKSLRKTELSKVLAVSGYSPTIGKHNFPKKFNF